MTSEKPPTIAPVRTPVTPGRTTAASPPPSVSPPSPAGGQDAAPATASKQTPPGPFSGPPRVTPARVAPAGAASVAGDAPASGGPRTVRLAVSKVDPWSVMKLSFLLSVAAGIMLVVGTAVIWKALDSMAVFTSVNDTIAVLAGRTDFFDLLEYVAFDRVISLATMIGVADIVILTALATIGAFLYNIVAALVGGVHVTLTDD